MYQYQLNFSMFCATSALDISRQYLNHPNIRICSVYRFHVSFHVRLILHELGISLPHTDGFSKVKNAHIKNTYYSICDDYGVGANDAWMHGDWFYTTDYAIFRHEINRNVSTKQPYTMDHYKVKRIHKKGIEKQICEAICLFSSYFSGPGKIKNSW